MPRLCARIIFALLFFASAARAQTQNLFYEPPTYPGLDPTVTADFNQDGIPDLASSDGTVMLGNGDGTFKTTHVTFPGSAGILLVADFNGDGKPDLLANGNCNCLWVAIGNGDGTFQTTSTVSVGIQLNSLVVADLNHDGKSDVIGLALGSTSTQLFAYVSKGDGTFTTMQAITVPASTVVASSDFNGDAKADIAIATVGTPSTILVLLGNGDGTFQSPVAAPDPGVGAVSMIAGDVNGDGRQDLVVSGYFGTTVQNVETVILIGNGDGTFQSPSTTLPLFGNLALGDVNGDSKVDLIEKTPSLRFCWEMATARSL